jgi:hypothetical protein
MEPSFARAARARTGDSMRATTRHPAASMPAAARRPAASSAASSSGASGSASSNIGFTSATRSAPGATSSRPSCTTAAAIDRYERSIVTTSMRSGTRARSSMARFVASRFATRGSWRSDPRSWP